MNQLQNQREQAIHLLRAGLSTGEVAQALGRSRQWVRKCRRRFQDQGWLGLAERSRAPHRHGRGMPAAVVRAVKRVRSQLEAEAQQGTGLKYVGARAIRTRLKAQAIQPLPSLSTIERILQQAGMTRPRQPHPEIEYPQLRPQQALELCQVDHMPRFLQGGEKVFCFNAIDVVSRYPSGQVKTNRRAGTAADFLAHVWQTLGIPTYTQVDNEACFIGGFRHPYVLGQCVRLALLVGTELVFSPVRHPQSNAFVERFHQDYQQHVWEDTYLANPTAVQQQGEHFFERYRHSRHHSALLERTPSEVHHQVEPRRLPQDFSRPAGKLPLYAGRVHFMRRVDPDGTVSVLNVRWSIPDPQITASVWATLDIQPAGAQLLFYDQAPDVQARSLLATHVFPLAEPVHVRAQTHSRHPPAERAASLPQASLSIKPHRDFPAGSNQAVPFVGLHLFRSIRGQAHRLKRFFSETIY